MRRSRTAAQSGRRLSKTGSTGTQEVSVGSVSYACEPGAARIQRSRGARERRGRRPRQNRRFDPRGQPVEGGPLRLFRERSEDAAGAPARNAWVAPELNPGGACELPGELSAEMGSKWCNFGSNLLP